MTSSSAPSRPPRKSPPVFRPRFLLSLLYLAAFFLVFSLLLIAPELLEVLNTIPTGPEQERLAEEVARDAIGPRLPIAIGLSLLALGVGGYYQRLPGLRSP